MSEKYPERDQPAGTEKFGDPELAGLLSKWEVTPPPSLRTKTIALMNTPPQFSMYVLTPHFQMATVGVALLLGIVTGVVVQWPSTSTDTVQIVAGLW
jgi:hypothetical protein